MKKNSIRFDEKENQENKTALLKNDFSSQTHIEEFTLGSLDQKCSNCNALHFNGEKHRNKKFKSCCHFGKIRFVQKSYLEIVKNYLKNKKFVKNIRSYNSALSFASMGANMPHMTSGPQFFKIHGQTYHNVYNVHPNNDERKYGQLYVIDTEEATQIRMLNTANSKCEKNIISELDQLIREINPYANAYKMISEIEK